MRDRNIDKYSSVLKGIYGKAIVSPALADFRLLFPHLSDEQINHVRQQRSYIACPPILIKNVYPVLVYDNELDGIYYAASIKTNGSFEDEIVYVKEAGDYAQAHWGNSLLDNKRMLYYQRIFLHDSQQEAIGFFGDSKLKANLHVIYNRNFDDLDKDISRPGYELLDQCITYMTSNDLLSEQLRVNSKPDDIKFNCADCGAGVCVWKRHRCGRELNMGKPESSWQTSLSKKMTDYLKEQGYVFKIDPEIAREKEFGTWQTSIREIKKFQNTSPLVLTITHIFDVGKANSNRKIP